MNLDRLKGIKSLPLELDKKDDETKLWEKIIESSYRKPCCPVCKEELILEVLKLVRPTNNHHIYGNITGSIQSFSIPKGEESDMEFRCRLCGCIIRCKGKGFVYSEEEGITLESIYSYSYEYKS